MVAVEIGILGFQGGVEEHERVLQRLGVKTRRIRYARDLEGVDAIVFPGGESTTIGIFLQNGDLVQPLREALIQGMPALATCAGTILLAREIEGKHFASLGILPIRVRRNAYGRQRESFVAPLTLAFDPSRPFPGVFIRAPQIATASPEIHLLSSLDGQPVMVQYGAILGCTFHPELAEDTRVHEYFLKIASSRKPRI
uniref:Pyridoxal 5'-phosphate synthase subunit PdxT n=1 Tax=Candidatus Caldatribacterium californiense TaxID=1454726 RepID=A0A7V3YI94_9BACT